MGAPTTAVAPTDQGPVVVSQLGEGPTQAATTPAAPAAPAAPSVPVTSLDGSVSYRGEALSGYTLQVRDAQSDVPVAVLDDLSTAQGLAVGAGSLVTDAQGRFSLRVANLTAGTALRVTATKDHVTLETVLIGTPAKAGYTVQAAGDGMNITELSTAIARIARGIVRTTQVLSPAAAQPVLERLNAKLQALAPRLEAELSRSPSMAGELIRNDAKNDNLPTLVSNANMLRELTEAAAELVAEVGRQAQTEGNRSPAAADPAVQQQLSQIELAGTVLRAGFDPAKGTLNLTNRMSGTAIDAAGGDLSSVTSRLVRNKNRNDGPAFAEAFKSVRLHAIDPKWTAAAIKLAPGLTPADFKAFEARLYDADDNLLTTATADPTEFRVADEPSRPTYNVLRVSPEEQERERSYFLPIIFKRVWGQSMERGDCDDFLDLQADSPRARKWNPEPRMPGLPNEAVVTMTMSDGDPIEFTVSDAKIQRLDPATGGAFSFGLRRKQWGDREVTGIHVDLLDRRGNPVGTADATESHVSRLNEEYKTTDTRVKFRPAHRTENDTDWTYGPFLGKAAKLVLRFTDRNGHIHESVQESHRDRYELPLRPELERIFNDNRR